LSTPFDLIILFNKDEKMSDIINFPDRPNKLGIKPSVAQELIENGYNPNSITEIKK